MDLREELREALELEDFPSPTLLHRAMAPVPPARRRHNYVRVMPIVAALAAAAVVVTLIAARVNSPAPSRAPLETGPTVHNLLGYQFITDQVGWLHLRPKSVDVVVGTVDGGHTWHRVLTVSGLNAGAIMQWFDPRDGVFMGQSGDKAILWRTADGGAHWRSSEITEGLNDFDSLETAYFLNRDRGWVFVKLTNPHGFSSSRTIYETLDGGGQWSVVGFGVWESARSNLQFLTPTWGVLTSDVLLGSISVTTDGGHLFHPLMVPDAFQQCPVNIIDCDTFTRISYTFIRPSTGLAIVTSCFHARPLVASSGCWATPFAPTSRELLVSDDGGLTWKVARKLPVTAGTTLAIDATHLIDIGPKVVTVSSDAGQTWSTAGQSPIPPGWFVGDAQFTDPDHGTLVVTDDPGAERFIFRYLRREPFDSANFSVLITDDGGATWRSVDLPQI
jgi:photosystem II stability/assembly factor-like uncharacterized protein